MKATKEKLVSAFKVIGSEGYGSNVTEAIVEHTAEGFKNYIKPFLEKYPELYPKYTRGTVVKAAPGTDGILCFGSLECAKSFRRRCFRLKKAYIVRVKGAGRRKVEWLWSGCMDLSTLVRIREKIKDPLNWETATAPVGTIGLEWVKVGSRVVKGDRDEF